MGLFYIPIFWAAKGYNKSFICFTKCHADFQTTLDIIPKYILDQHIDQRADRMEI